MEKKEARKTNREEIVYACVTYKNTYLCPPPSMLSCDTDLVSRLRTGYMVNTAAVYTLETSTAQMNLATSVHYVIKSTEDDQSFFNLNSEM